MEDVELMKNILEKHISQYNDWLGNAVAQQLNETATYYRGCISGLETALKLISKK